MTAGTIQDQPEAISAAPWWRTEPLCIVELADPLHVAAQGRAAFEPQRVVRRMVELGATAAHIFPLACHLDGKTLYFRHHSPGDPPPAFDYLEEWLAHSRPVGLRTIVYFNVHSVKGPYAAQHPDWQQRRVDGSAKDDIYTIESTFCVNSPWRQWVFERLRELCSYPIDGIFYDGPAFFEDTCFCSHCRAKFAARYGGAMPPKGDVTHADFHKLVEFQADSLCDFLRDSAAVIRQVSRQILFYVNSNPLQPPYITGRDNRKLAHCQDILAAEGGFLGGDLLRDVPIWKVGMNAKLLRTQASAAGVPHLVFDSVIHTPWTYYTLPAAEARLLWASSVAHGAGTWMSAYKDAMHRPAVEAIAPLQRFARRHRRELFEADSLASIALVVSESTLNYYGGADVPGTDFTTAKQTDRPGNSTQELYGWYHALWGSQQPFDVIDDAELTAGDLSRYRLIILPNVACMSLRTAERLRPFVEAGGTLIGTFETALYDESGRRRDRGALDALFGVRRLDQPVQGPRRWDYLFNLAASGSGGSAIETCMPSPAYAIAVDALSGTECAMSFSQPLADRYADLPVDSSQPAMTQRRCGQGRAIFFACDIGAAMHRWRLPEHLAIVRGLAQSHSRHRISIPDAPLCLDLSLQRSRDGHSVLLHLVNYTAGMTRPIERIVPLRDLDITIQGIGEATAARALFQPASLPLVRSDGQVTLRLPVLNEYELVRFEFTTQGREPH